MDDPLSQLQDTPADDDSLETNDLILMKKAYINERQAPELLKYEEELVTRLQDQIQNQLRALWQEDTVENTDATSAEGSLVTAIWRLELARARHVLRAYLRTRLQKLEEFVMAVLDDPEAQARLSARELQYAKDYFIRMGHHLKANVLEGMPPEFASLVQQSNASEGHDMLSAPDLDRHVFVRVLEDRGAVDLDPEGDEVVELKKDDLYVMRYRPIRELLAEKWVELI